MEFRNANIAVIWYTYISERYRRNRLMKIKNGFVLRDVGGQAVVIAVGEASKTFH